MYKVFVQQCELKLLPYKKNGVKKTELVQVDDRLPDWPVLKNQILSSPTNRYKVYCTQPKKCWNNFKKRFRIMHAAGGLVVNSNNEILLIKRLGMWDLPKGKIEKGEDIVDCAIREVEEECAVFGLGITGKITTTYHVMRRNKNKYLKESHWYMMKTDQTAPGIPQTEEGIEKVRWVSKTELQKKLKKSWPSVREVIKESKILKSK
ncbi:MAG: NUDIX domain-containing protein [Flavobacteriales bacterium]|nr:NUDIX domain-containing protein [Flavobacteriales bacterium]